MKIRDHDPDTEGRGHARLCRRFEVGNLLVQSVYLRLVLRQFVADGLVERGGELVERIRNAAQHRDFSENDLRLIGGLRLRFFCRALNLGRRGLNALARRRQRVRRALGHCHRRVLLRLTLEQASTHRPQHRQYDHNLCNPSHGTLLSPSLEGFVNGGGCGPGNRAENPRVPPRDP